MGKSYSASVVFGGTVDGSLAGAIGSVTGGLARVESSVEQNIQALRSQKKVISSLDFNALRQSQDHMQKSQQRVEELKKEIAACPAPTSKMRQELERAEKTAEKATLAFERQKKQLNDTKGKLKQAGINVNDLRREEARLTAELERQERRQDALNRMRSHGGAIAGSVKSAISGLMVAGAAATAAIGSAVGGIVALTSSVASHGDVVAKTADKLGIGIDALQEYRYAAERSGVSTSAFDSSLERMTKRISEAAGGSGPAANAIKELGLSAGYLKAIGPDKALAELADALTHVKNPADRVRIAIELFGKEGAGMVNMLKDGSAGLSQLREDAKATGYVLSDDAARNAEAYQDAMLDMQLSIGGVKNIVGSALLPVVTDAFKEITAWIAENRDVVTQWSAQFAGKVKDAIPMVANFAKGMTSVFLSISKTIGSVTSAVGGFENLAKILAAVVAGRTAGKLFGVAKDTWGLAKAAKDFASASGGVSSVVGAFAGTSKAVPAMGSVAGFLPKLKTGFLSIGVAVKGAIAPLLPNPITWAVAAAIAVYALWKNWDAVVDATKRAWNAIVDICAPIVALFKDIWSSVSTGFKEAWSGISTWFGALWSGLQETWSGLWDSLPDGAAVVDGIKGLWSGVLGWFGALWGGVQETWSGLWDSLPDGAAVMEGMKGLWSGVLGWFGALWSGVQETWSGLWDSLPDGAAVMEGMKGLWSGLSGWFGDLWGGVKATWSDLWDSLPDGSAAIEGIKGLWSGLIGIFSGIGAKIKEAFGGAMDWIKGKLDWVRGAVGKVLSVLGIGGDEPETPEEKERREGREAEAKAYAQDTLGVAMAGIDLTGMGLDMSEKGSEMEAQKTISRAEQIVSNTTNSTQVHQQNSISIQASPGQDPEEIAAEVIRQLKEIEHGGGVLYDRGGV